MPIGRTPAAVMCRRNTCLRTCRLKDGSYLYGPYMKYMPRMGINQPKGSSLRTQACNMALYRAGSTVTKDDLRIGLGHLVQHHRFAVAGVGRPIPHESWYQISGYFYLYGHQYAALCLEHLSGADEQRFWPPLVRAVLKTRQPDGSFWDYPMYGYHKFYGTGYALMTLGRCPEPIASSISPPPPADDAAAERAIEEAATLGRKLR